MSGRLSARRVAHDAARPAAPGVEGIQAIIGADPQRTIRGEGERFDFAPRQAAGIVGLVAPDAHGTVLADARQALLGTGPQRAVGAKNHGADRAARQALRAGEALETLLAGALPVQRAVQRGHPHAAVRSLRQAGDGAVCQRVAAAGVGPEAGHQPAAGIEHVDAIAFGAQPQPAVGRFQRAHDGRMAGAQRVGWAVAQLEEGAAGGIVVRDAAAPGAGPGQAGAVHQQGANAVVADAGSAGAVVLQAVDHGQAGAVDHVDALAERAEPDLARQRFGNAVDPEVAQPGQLLDFAAGRIVHGGALARAADPDAATTVLEQADRIGRADRRREAAVAQPALQAGVAGHPQAAFAVQQDGAQLVVGQAVAVALHVAVMGEAATGGIKDRQAVVGGQPQHAAGQFRDAFHAIAGQAVLALRVVPVLGKAFGARVKHRQAAADGADPQPSIARGVQGADVAAAD